MALNAVRFWGCLMLLGVTLFASQPAGRSADSKRMEFDLPLIAADNKNIQYTGRIDLTDPKKPKFWAPGTYIQARFQGTSCAVVVQDEVLYGKSHNYLEVAVDDRTPFRIQTTGADNMITVAEGLTDGPHTITVCKDTEAGIGYLQFLGFKCAGLLPMPRKPSHKLEFIGDSITCGAGSDLTDKPCGQGEWYDQHNAYLSYGPTTARLLHAQWHLSSVSGIGMQHSCCDMGYTMPDVFDKINLSPNGPAWDFKQYQPDAVTICLGQNDGTENLAAFRASYVGFIQQVRIKYPHAQIVCLTSPMGDAPLTAALKDTLTQIVTQFNQAGDKRVHAFFFSRHYGGGCGGHPDLAAHQQIAGELTAYLRTLLGW